MNKVHHAKGSQKINYEHVTSLQISRHATVEFSYLRFRLTNDNILIKKNKLLLNKYIYLYHKRDNINYGMLNVQI